MSSKTNDAESDFLRYALLGETPAWDGNSNLYVSLHSSNPGEGGSQSTSETSYGGYARQPISRSDGWNVSGGTASNANIIEFPTVVSGNQTLRYLGIGTSSSGAGKLLWYGPFTPISIAPSSIIRFLAGSIVIAED